MVQALNDSGDSSSNYTIFHSFRTSQQPIQMDPAMDSVIHKINGLSHSLDQRLHDLTGSGNALTDTPQSELH